MRVDKSLFCFFISFFISVLGLSSGVSQADPLDNWHWRNPLPQGNHLNGVAFGNGIFVAVGDEGTILTSSDGATWNKMTSGGTEPLLGISYGSGTFIAVGDGILATSPDGENWTTRFPGIRKRLRGLTHGIGIFVAVGDEGTVVVSPDSVSWTAVSSGVGDDLLGITYAEGKFVAVGGKFPPPFCAV